MNPLRILKVAAIWSLIALLTCLITVLADGYAGPPSVTVPDPRTISGKLQAKPQSSGMSLAYPAFNVIEPVSDEGAEKTFRTWHMVTTSIDQESWMEHHIGRSVFALGRRGEREGNFYFLIDAIRETR